jgi:hypothetical protein
MGLFSIFCLRGTVKLKAIKPGRPRIRPSLLKYRLDSLPKSVHYLFLNIPLEGRFAGVTGRPGAAVDAKGGRDEGAPC